MNKSRLAILLFLAIIFSTSAYYYYGQDPAEFLWKAKGGFKFVEGTAEDGIGYFHDSGPRGCKTILSGSREEQMVVFNTGRQTDEQQIVGGWFSGIQVEQIICGNTGENTNVWNCTFSGTLNTKTNAFSGSASCSKCIKDIDYCFGASGVTLKSSNFVSGDTVSGKIYWFVNKDIGTTHIADFSIPIVERGKTKETPTPSPTQSVKPTATATPTPTVDLCSNGELDSGEERVDCGGTCPACEYDVKLVRVYPQGTIPADGKTTIEYAIEAMRKGDPVKDLTYSISAVQLGEKIFSTPGTLSASSVTTNANGKAFFTYTAPLTPEKKFFKNAKIGLIANGPNGKRAVITLSDPKPIITVLASPKSMEEGTDAQMSYFDVKIIDESSEEWSVNVKTNLGSFIQITTGASTMEITDKTRKKEYNFNWVEPPSVVELIAAEMTYIQDHKNDWSNYKSNLKDSTEGFALDLALSGDPVYDAYSEITDYTDQMESWKGNVEQLSKDVNEFKTSTSAYEKFLRSLSIGVEGLQAFYATKGFVEDKLGSDADGDSDSLDDYLEDVQDNTIDYGCDSLQSGLRYWANLVREGNFDTETMPIHVIVKVTNGHGFSAEKDEVLQYTYHYLKEKAG